MSDWFVSRRSFKFVFVKIAIQRAGIKELTYYLRWFTYRLTRWMLLRLIICSPLQSRSRSDSTASETHEHLTTTYLEKQNSNLMMTYNRCLQASSSSCGVVTSNCSCGKVSQTFLWNYKSITILFLPAMASDSPATKPSLPF